jgi:hypothetical protein
MSNNLTQSSASQINIIKALRVSEINISDIELGNKHDKKAKLSIKNKLIIMQTPLLEVDTIPILTNCSDVYEFTTLLTGRSQRKIKRFSKFTEDFESHIFNIIKEKYNTWFKENKIDYKPLIREKKDGTLFIKWIFDKSITPCIDKNNNEFDISKIKIRDQIQFIIELSYLWINTNQFGIVVTVHKMRVYEFNEPIVNEYEFNNSESISKSDSDDEAEDMISLLATETKSNKQKTLNVRTDTRSNPLPHANEFASIKNNLPKKDDKTQKHVTPQLKQKLNTQKQSDKKLTQSKKPETKSKFLQQLSDSDSQDIPDIQEEDPFENM